ncbi:MAG: serine/threonine protein kinase [Planctomycetes bacterium]|nr:serine/threonine protein kinase [Planctomycetota bacterium]
MSAAGGDHDPDLDRTRAFRPEGAPPPASPEELPRVPGITLHHEIARGGMGIVYSGRQDFLDRRVAVKLLSKDLIGEKFAQRFQREAKLLAGIKHQNIVACHAAGTTDDGQSYLVMEFVDGPNLKTWIAEQGPLAPAAALRLTKSVALALGHAHTLGVIHRDVKPENILLETVTSTAIDVAFPFTPKLVDLGLARMTSESAGFGLTSPGSVMGTPSTMSPEQFDDPDSVDFRTDIYGLGCVLYEMLVGAPAYRGKKMTEIVASKRQPLGPDPCAEAPHVPRTIGELVCSMLAADRERRPRSYRDLEERLEKLLAALPKDVPRPLRPLPPAAAADEPQTMVGARKPPVVSEPTGPGLLRSAELSFLREGMAVGGGAATVFREEAAATAPATQAAAGSAVLPPPTTEPPPKSRGVWIGVAVTGAVLVAGVVWFATRSGGEPAPPVTPTAPNARPVVGALEGPDEVELRKWATLVAPASDADGDELDYRWTAPIEVVFREQTQNTTKVCITDGLPGEQFDVQVAVADGHGKPTLATKRLALAATDFPSRPFLLAMKQESQWRFTPADPGLLWTKRLDEDAISCRPGTTMATATAPLGTETFWQLSGRLESQVSDAMPDHYGSVGVRLEVGDRGWSIVCRRHGDMGERWSVELRPEQKLGGSWDVRLASGETKRVEWQEADDVDAAPLAEFSLTRRRGTLTLRCGQGETFEQIEVPLADGEEPFLSLWVEQGAGLFRDFTLR